VNTDKRECGKTMVAVHFVSKEELAPLFGKAIGNIKSEGCFALVREDLHPLIQKFVVQHELYHLRDDKKWLGVLGRELRANVVPALRNPIGFFATVFATLMSKERMRFYLDRVCKKY